MVEISSSGSGEGPGEGNRPAYSTTPFSPRPRELPPASPERQRLTAACVCRLGTRSAATGLCRRCGSIAAAWPATRRPPDGGGLVLRACRLRGARE